MRMQTRQLPDGVTSNGRSKRAATAISDKLWPNATIPYVFGNVTGRFLEMLTYVAITKLRFVNPNLHFLASDC